MSITIDMNRAQLIETIGQILNDNPNGYPAKAIAKEIRNRGNESIVKKDINPILYSERDVFVSKNYSPPVWFLKELSTIVPVAGRPDIPEQKYPPYIAPPPNSPDPLPKAVPEASELFRPRIERPLPKRIFPEACRPLYDWQQRAVDAWVSSGSKGIVEAVTGTGKTLLAIHVINQYIQDNRRCLVVVPSVTLLEQWITVFKVELNINISSILGGKHGKNFNPDCQVTIGVVHSLSNISDELDSWFDLIVADECHRYASLTFQKILIPNIPNRLGLTATLERSSDNGVDEVLLPYFESIVFNYGFQDAKKDRVIADYSVFTIGVELDPDELGEYQEAGRAMGGIQRTLNTQFNYPPNYNAFMARVQVAQGRFDKEGRLAKSYFANIQKRKRIIAESPAKLEIAVQLGMAIKSATRTLVFCETVEASRLIYDVLSGEGVLVRSYHSKLTDRNRSEILEEFGAGEIQCVVAVRALDEGIDVPDVDFGIILAGSRQRRQMIQRMGRAIRKKPDGRSACFAVVYAKETTEDPKSGDPDNGNLSLILEHAEKVTYIDGKDFNSYDFSRDVATSIFKL